MSRVYNPPILPTAMTLDPALQKFLNQDNLDQSKIKPHKKMAMKGVKKGSAYFKDSAALLGDADSDD